MSVASSESLSASSAVLPRRRRGSRLQQPSPRRRGEGLYEQIRKPAPDPTDFKTAFELHTPEHCAWLEAVGSL